MASAVDIVNLALARLGDSATVSSIDPPEGSVQAEHAARFYPIARDSLLEMHAWGFATRRASPAPLTVSPSSWAYAYAVPSGAVNLLAVLPPDATDDMTSSIPLAYNTYGVAQGAVNTYTPQPFVIETDDDGTEVVYTNQADAVLRYTVRVTDTTRFSPLFVNALAWFLAADLAGPILKGDAGRKTALNCTQMGEALLSKAVVSDANDRHQVIETSTPWMGNR